MILRDDRLTLGNATRLRDYVQVKTVISPEDQEKLNFWGYKIKDLNLQGSLDDTVYHSKEVIGRKYYCGHTFFFYKPPQRGYSQQNVYPDTCPLGDPSYIDV